MSVLHWQLSLWAVSSTRNPSILPFHKPIPYCALLVLADCCFRSSGLLFFPAVNWCSLRREQQLQLICEHNAHSCSSVKGVPAPVLLMTKYRYSLGSVAITATWEMWRSKPSTRRHSVKLHLTFTKKQLVKSTAFLSSFTFGI